MSAKYIWLAGLLKNLIEENTGDTFKLPTEAALCQKYGVSRQTVRKALSVLEAEHLIEKRLLRYRTLRQGGKGQCGDPDLFRYGIYLPRNPCGPAEHFTGSRFFLCCLCHKQPGIGRKRDPAAAVGIPRPRYSKRRLQDRFPDTEP